MARPLRIHIPGKAYHLYARGDGEGAIFRDDTDCAQFLKCLTAALDRFAVKCLAYCLLRHHYHLLVIPGGYSVSRLMHQVNCTYCLWFNRRHGRVGHVLHGRFGSRIVDDGAYLLNAVRYIALNPVAAGRVTNPGDWAWSSYRATAGLCDVPSFLSLEDVWRALGSPDPDERRVRFVQHVASDANGEKLLDAFLVGSEQLTQRVHPLLEPYRGTREFRYAERFATRPALHTVLLNGDSSLSLKRAASEAFHRHGYTLREIGELIGRSPATISRWIASV